MTSLTREINAEDALQLLQKKMTTLVDVRAEIEFAKGALPYAQNIPILTTAERHQVGTCYKQKGQEAAIQLGHRLVAPFKTERVSAWAQHAGSDGVLVTCWRGGLRSQIACTWLSEVGVPSLRVRGGYKAMRNLLLGRLGNLPPFRILAGLTGSGKTELLHAIPRNTVDLEALAQHRGSTFGGMGPDHPQPAQASFENAVLFHLPRSGPVYIEDESAFIGSVSLPQEWVSHARIQDCIWLDSALPDRVQRIWAEYVMLPLQKGVPCDALLDHLIHRLVRLERRLGGARTQDLIANMKSAFNQPDHWQGHAWIGQLLAEYYDPRYHFAFERSRKKVVFQGDFQQCLQWIQSN